MLFRVFWTNAPRWLYVPIYLALGWAALGYAGDLFDAAFKANRRNVNLLRRHLEEERDRNPALRPTLRRV